MAFRMNERDFKLMRALMERIDGYFDGGVVIIDAPYTQFVRINLVILKTLVDELGRSGIFISVDRPHQYMAHLMKMHGVSMDGVTFIDIISRFSAESKRENARVRFVDGPFHINTLTDAISRMRMDGENVIEGLEKRGFVMIDNIATLQIYNTNHVVELFINNFIFMAKTRGDIFIPLVLDSTKSSMLFESACSLADLILKVNTDFSVSERTESREASAGSIANPEEVR